MSKVFKIRREALELTGAGWLVKGSLQDEVSDLIESVFENAGEEVGDYGCDDDILALVVDWSTMDPKRWLHTDGYGLEIVKYAQRAIQVALERNGE